MSDVLLPLNTRTGCDHRGFIEFPVPGEFRTRCTRCGADIKVEDLARWIEQDRSEPK